MVMKQQTKLEVQIQRWTAAGIIDQTVADRITAFEVGQDRHVSLRWPVILAMVFGGILLAAGVTLFVAAHWAELSPLERFALMILMVGAFQIGGAAVADRFPALSTTLHAIGTVTLGAAIFLTAQIFNLHENWATGVLLWAVGAAIGFVLLRDWAQATALSLLVPAWLVSQWMITTEHHWGGNRPLAIGLFLTAVCYLSARSGDQESTGRRALVWIGGIALLPCAGVAIAVAMEDSVGYRLEPGVPPGARASGSRVDHRRCCAAASRVVPARPRRMDQRSVGGLGIRAGRYRSSLAPIRALRRSSQPGYDARALRPLRARFSLARRVGTE